MFPIGNETVPAPAMHNQPPLQTTTNQPQTLPACYSQPNQWSYNLQFPPIRTNQITTHQVQLEQPSQQIHHQVQASYSEDDLNMGEEDSSTKHQWQTVSNKRKRITYQTPAEIAEQIQTTNRFDSLSELPHDNNQYRQPPTSNNPAIPKREPKPPPIYIYGVNDFKGMLNNLAMVTENETYTAKALPNNTIKIMPNVPETYRKLIQHVRKENIIHHTYQLKQERAYRIVIRDLHHSIPIPDITEELNKKGHKVRNMINARHRVSKEPLPLFFVDLEPQSNNKEIYNVESLLNCKIRVEPPRRKNTIVQCTRCQDYGHSKRYCTKPFNCVKCSGSHDTQSCRKPRDTPAKCVLCNGNHPANYKGCTVYRDLINTRNKDNPRRINNTPQQATNYVRQNISYSQVASERPATHQTSNSPADIASQLTMFLNEFKNMFNQLLNQNTMILTMLTTIINK